MKILLGTHYLAKAGGTESYTFALAMELKRRGHEVEHFAIIRGGVSAMLEEQGVPFLTSDRFDLLLANHTTVVEQLWPRGFTVQTCHGKIAALEQPSPFADAYVAVSEEVSEHLRSKGYRAAAVIANGIDCNRFCQKRPISSTLKTVLSLCQSDVANDFIRRCCQQEGIRFLQSNKFTDNVWAIEDLINESDLVVGLGRSAYDAMACGRCVLVYDFREYMGEFLGDGMLTPDSIGHSMLCNCSGRASRLKYDEQAFKREMQKYSPELAAWGREYALEHLNIEVAVRKYLDVYKHTKDRQNGNPCKGFLKRLQEEDSRKIAAAKSENEQLRQQLAGMQHQMKDMENYFLAKGQKHLRAIRALLWLSIVLLLAIAVFAFYTV